MAKEIKSKEIVTKKEAEKEYDVKKDAEPSKIETEKPLSFDWQQGARPRKIMFASDDIPMAWKEPPNKSGSILKKSKDNR